MFRFKGRTIEKIAVVGSGQIGPDIALYFSKVFTAHAVPVVVVDIAEEALKAGEARTYKKIDKGIESGAFKPDVGAAMKANITFTSDYDAVKDASLVVEAATEDRDLKRRIFASLEPLCAPDALFASNSSHLEPEVIFEGLDARTRGMVIHYFFPAERNPIVEIVPGADTNPAMTSWAMALYEWMGKFPVQVGSRYGYAVDPIFEGLFQAAALCVEEGLGTVKEVDTVARETLKLGVGPFTAMNLTGGNPITHHGLAELHDKAMPWFNPPRLLEEAVEKHSAWEVAGRGEKVEVADAARKKIAARMTGAYFGLVCEILDAGISNIADLEMAVSTALVVAPPFKMMNRTGVAESLALVEAYAADHDGFKVSESLRAQAASGKPWKVPVILREDRGDVAVLTIRRPEVLNAMNAPAIAQLGEVFQELESDAGIRAVVITGYGKKAFVSGADIGYLSNLDSRDASEGMCHDFQRSIAAIENMSKPVVCAMNGIAFGGGCEIAMGCHARIAPAGLRTFAGQPEVNLGIIPGAGGTQRLPRIVGFEVANEMLRNGKPISSERALEIGLVDRLSEGDLLDDAVAMAHEILDGSFTPKPINKDPMSPPETLPPVELGHLSTVVDELLCRVIVEGARMTLADGLNHEAKLFADVCQTEDARIGIENFITNGARAKAEFVNR